jgi:hypothetical protein
MKASELLSFQLREAAQQRSSRDIVEPGYSGTGYWWNNYPAYVSGIDDYDAKASSTGSNLEAVAATSTVGSDAVAQRAGLDGTPTGASVGGTAAY